VLVYQCVVHAVLKVGAVLLTLIAHTLAPPRFAHPLVLLLVLLVSVLCLLVLLLLGCHPTQNCVPPLDWQTSSLARLLAVCSTLTHVLVPACLLVAIVILALKWPHVKATAPPAQVSKRKR
jgi:hypothetical protein